MQVIAIWYDSSYSVTQCTQYLKVRPAGPEKVTELPSTALVHVLNFPVLGITVHSDIVDPILLVTYIIVLAAFKAIEAGATNALPTPESVHPVNWPVNRLTEHKEMVVPVVIWLLAT